MYSSCDLRRCDGGQSDLRLFEMVEPETRAVAAGGVVHHEQRTGHLLDAADERIGPGLVHKPRHQMVRQTRVHPRGHHSVLLADPLQRIGLRSRTRIDLQVINATKKNNSIRS